MRYQIIIAVIAFISGCGGSTLPVDNTECQIVECTPWHDCKDTTLVCDYKAGVCVVPAYVGDCGDRGEPECPPEVRWTPHGCNQGTEPHDGICQVIELHPTVCVVVRDGY
jgi:hypothetical protein